MPSHYVVYSLIWLSILFACTDINTIYYSQHNWIVLVNELLNLSKKFFKIHRSISGSGVRKTLKIIKKEIPQLKIKSFNSRKRTVKYTTGLINNRFEFSGRHSTIKSDGYIDRASSDLNSYFFQGI